MGTIDKGAGWATRLFTALAALFISGAVVFFGIGVYAVIMAASDGLPAGRAFLEARLASLVLRLPTDAGGSEAAALLGFFGASGFLFCLGWGGVALLLRRWTGAMGGGEFFTSTSVRCLRRAAWIMAALAVSGTIISLAAGLALRSAVERTGLEWRLDLTIDWMTFVLALVLALAARAAKRGAALEEDARLTV